MTRKMAVGLAAVVIILLIAGLWYLGTGPSAQPWASGPVAQGPRPVRERPVIDSPMAKPTEPGATDTMEVGTSDRQILFGDFHAHTSFSIDAAIFGLPAVQNFGVALPSDACDFARYCSALDFWSINDHAEGMTPRSWADSVAAIRACNVQSGDPANPDMVSFVGYEWSQGDRAEAKTHYGHKNVIFREWEAGRTPERPISSQERYTMVRMLPAPARGAMGLMGDFQRYQDWAGYMQESSEVPVCAYDVSSDALPANCREVAETPSELYRKLKETGLDAVVIPHGLAWGRTNPRDADFANQMAIHNPDYQTLIESYSGHGNSEVFAQPAGGVRDKVSEKKCQDEPDPVKRAECGQVLDSFLPSWNYVARQSTQYNLALGDFSQPGKPRRARFGIMASSDGHKARPGTGYKEFDRTYMTDTKDLGEPATALSTVFGSPSLGSFYYTGGLIGVHSAGRHRDQIWDGIDNKQVYGTSGERILLWFDLLNGTRNGAPAELPMGSETAMTANPKFRVQALGAFRQKPGCPGYAEQALGAQRIADLCRGECYHPADQRKAITRIEIVRIRPQAEVNEPIAPLIDDVWRSFDCPADGGGCAVEFEDEEFSYQERETLYYARAIQEAQPTINGDNFRCDYNEAGECVTINFCVGENAMPDEDCLGEAEPRAWSSPIFIDYTNGNQ